MSRCLQILKKPKLEEDEELEENEKDKMAKQIRNEQEAAFLALIKHQTNEVLRYRELINGYKTKLDKAEETLKETQNKLAHLQAPDRMLDSKTNLGNNIKEVKGERSPSPITIKDSSSEQSASVPHLGQNTMTSSEGHLEVEQGPASCFYENENGSHNQTHFRPKLLIPAVTPNILHPVKARESTNEIHDTSGFCSRASVPSHVNSIAKLKGKSTRKISSECKIVDTQSGGMKRKLEQKDYNELVPLINSCSSSQPICCQMGCLLASQHKRKLRNLVLCPTDDQHFVTSALDGVVNLWQIQRRGSSAKLLKSINCSSARQRRWPEDVAWHPQGDSLFSVYSADGGDSQIAVVNVNKGKERWKVRFLEDKPHIKGIINSIMFMPWDETCFVTGGSDHAVFLWSEKDGKDIWEPLKLHRNIHSSAVMGVAGLYNKKVVMSAGADKRVIGYDIVAETAESKLQIDSKCMSVLPNPRDVNLLMVQTGSPERQLRLYDIRARQVEIHTFGWKQESSDTQSALINQSWSPDGLYITSGSADPAFHIFDIRYNTRKPSQTVRAHQRRVFRAAWHHTLPLLISISSDLNIGLHSIT